MVRRELPAAGLAFPATLDLLALIYFGSRGLRDFDSALVGCAVGTVFAIAGLGLTAPSLWWNGRLHWFLLLTHLMTVVEWLLTNPFSKLFQVVQRLASIGVALYQYVKLYGRQPRSHACSRCRTVLACWQLIDELNATPGGKRMSYDLGAARKWLHEYCPTCKCVSRRRAPRQGALQGQARALGLAQ